MIRISFVTSVLVTCLFGIPVAQAASYANDPYVYQKAYELIGAYDAWKLSTGSKDVVVAVIDNGFDHYHPDLVQNVWKNKDEIPNNNIDDDNNGYVDDIVGWNFVPEDLNGDAIIDDVESRGNNNPRPTLEASDDIVSGHGTAVAGLIGATGYNNYLGTGINWRVSLMNLKIVGNSGSGTIGYVPDAIRYAVDNGADIISMSIVGILTDPEAMNDAVAYAQKHDVVIVAAAGNTTRDLNARPLYPVCSDALVGEQQVIGVSAVTLDRAFAAFSNYGSNCIDITAPGVMISSTVRYGDVGNVALTQQYRGGLQGTSFATPLVAGTAALIRSTYPRLSADQIITAILESTSQTPSQDTDLYANLFGAGLLQVDAALARAKEMALQTDILAVGDTGGTLYQIAPQVSAMVDGGRRTYYVGNLLVRQLLHTSDTQVLTQNAQKTLAYVMSAYNESEHTYTVSIYHTRGVKLRDMVVSSDIEMDGIFLKGDTVYMYTRSADGVQTYRVSEGDLVTDERISLPEVQAVTYDNLTGRYLLQQYTRTISTWDPLTGNTASEFIPGSYGTLQFVITAGGTIVTEFDEVGIVWDGTMDSVQIFSYITI